MKKQKIKELFECYFQKHPHMELVQSVLGGLKCFYQSAQTEFPKDALPERFIAKEHLNRQRARRRCALCGLGELHRRFVPPSGTFAR